MKYIVNALAIISFSLLTSFPSITNDRNSFSMYTKKKIFLKTRTELKVSEATGKISLVTGNTSLDDKIAKYYIEDINKLFNLNNGNRELYDKFGMGRIYVLSFNNNYNADIESITEEMSKEEVVEFCEPVFIGTSAGVKEHPNVLIKDNVPNDEMFYRQWYLQNSGSVEPSSSGGSAKIGADIKILKAWEIEKGSDEVIVAILDSGIRDDHPDLSPRMWINKGEIPGNGIDDDNNGYIDDYKGWDFAYNDRRPEDGFGHGTNIATVIGANTNNLIGFAGVDQKCKLMNCKNLNADNSGEYSWWAQSIKYAVDNGAKIINMSEGGDDYSQVLRTAVEYAIESGVLVNAAMMNKGDSRDYYPASYRGVFSVGATDTDDKRCRRFSWGGGSCWGKHISVVAPGNKIYGLDYEDIENYEVYWSGTSQSTAIVSGIAALLLAQNQNRTADDIKKIIKLSARDQVGDPREDKAGWDQYYGYGRVDCSAALNYDLTSPPEEVEKEEKVNDENPDSTRDDTEESNSKPAKANTRQPDN